jgi:hypothetical protein
MQHINTEKEDAAQERMQSFLFVQRIEILNAGVN